MERNDEHAESAAQNTPDTEDVEDLEPAPEDKDAVRGGFFREASGFDSETETSERGRL